MHPATKHRCSVRLPSIMISGLDEVIENHLMEALETDRLPNPRLTSVCLSRDADKRQPMGQLLSSFGVRSLTLRSSRKHRGIMGGRAWEVREGRESFGLDGGLDEWDQLDADLMAFSYHYYLLQHDDNEIHPSLLFCRNRGIDGYSTYPTRIFRLHCHYIARTSVDYHPRFTPLEIELYNEASDEFLKGSAICFRDRTPGIPGLFVKASKLNPYSLLTLS